MTHYLPENRFPTTQDNKTTRDEIQAKPGRKHIDSNPDCCRSGNQTLESGNYPIKCTHGKFSLSISVVNSTRRGLRDEVMLHAAGSENDTVRMSQCAIARYGL